MFQINDTKKHHKETQHLILDWFLHWGKKKKKKTINDIIGPFEKPERQRVDQIKKIINLKFTEDDRVLSYAKEYSCFWGNAQ